MDRNYKKILKILFGSTVRVEILSLFFENPDRSFYQSEIAFKTSSHNHSPIRYELEKLIKIGLVSSHSGKYFRFYYLNKTSPLYKPLHPIFSKR